MPLTVLFEHWHLGDGNYPAFSRGDSARLAFELYASRCETPRRTESPSLDQIRDCDYRATARIIRTYDRGNSQFAVLEADWLRFYCTDGAVAEHAVGELVAVEGQLALDHYMWVEFLDRYPNTPDLFYNVIVERIRRVRIAERFVSRSDEALAYPTSLDSSNYGPAD